MSAMEIESFLSNHKIWLDFFTAIGTVGATIVALYVRRNERLSGVSITDISQQAVATLENKTRINVAANVKKYLLDNGQDKQTSLMYLKKDINSLKNEIRKIVNWSSISTYSLNSGEKVQFHFSDIVSENVYATFIVLKILTDNEKTRYYLLRFSGSIASDSDIMRLAQPQNQWIVVTSFEG